MARCRDFCIDAALTTHGKIHRWRKVPVAVMAGERVMDKCAARTGYQAGTLAGSPWRCAGNCAIKQLTKPGLYEEGDGTRAEVGFLVCAPKSQMPGIRSR